MHSAVSSEITIPSSGSRLLSESPFLPSASSHTGHGGSDLSLSELSITDPSQTQKPFSLIAAVNPLPHFFGDDEENPFQGGGDADREMTAGIQDGEDDKRLVSKLREEKLQHDLFILKKINASFAVYNNALRNVESANEQVAGQLDQTDALLNKYVGILSKSEEFSRLIFDEKWQGAEEDEAIIEQERRDAAQKALREAEERTLSQQRENERLAREEREKIAREEHERVAQERKERTGARGVVRGVRGTRASMRGVRGTTNTRVLATTAVRGRASVPQSGTSRGISQGAPRRS